VTQCTIAVNSVINWSFFSIIRSKAGLPYLLCWC